ncbi:MAG: DUF2480 family protein [Bacteroidetes bacterium]|nr:DUF2480 family protein [Bacteroidota bacterium]HET6245466.1 DUF2480 family protein [Bacteroidia bacterium]
MDKELEIENKVDKSGLITLNLEDFYPQGDRILFDIKECLYQGIILKEKEFREFIKNHNWDKYQNKFVAIYCSADAIVPTWAYMLLTAELEPFASKLVFGDLHLLETVLFLDALKNLEIPKYKDERVIIKGCSKFPVPPSAYVELTRLLRPVAKSIMFGEACSTVPIYKKK